MNSKKAKQPKPVQAFRLHMPAAQPKTHAAAPGMQPSVVMNMVTLLTPEQQLSANITPHQLGSYIELISVRVQTIFADSPTACGLLLDVTLRAEAKPSLMIRHQGEADQARLQALHEAFQLLVPTHTRRDRVVFRIHFVVTPQGGQT
jgi:hypothetical protein